VKELPIELKEKKYADVVEDANGKEWYLLDNNNGDAQVISKDFEERATLNHGEYTELHPAGNRVHFHDIELPDHNYAIKGR
jgi:hypothetical protein